MSEATHHHYVIIRDDLPPGVKLAQTIHATGESSDRLHPAGTFAYALAADDEVHLLEIARKLWEQEIPHTVVYEPDGPYGGAAMAIGIWPTTDKDRVRRVTSDLRLAR